MEIINTENDRQDNSEILSGGLGVSTEELSSGTPIESCGNALDENMGKSLLEQLPGIVAAGKRKAEAILERAQNESKIDLQSRELVDSTGSFENLPEHLHPGETSTLIYGDNLLAMAALLAGTDDRPSLRGKVETKATGQGNHPDVQRKSRAALAWCEKINQLPAHERMHSQWSYVLIEQGKFEEWSSRGANLREILDLATIRDLSRKQMAFV